MLRRDIDGWKDTIEVLPNDTQKKAIMGKAARDVIEERYSLIIWGPRVAEIKKTYEIIQDSGDRMVC